jgi:hypothetical protein
VFYLKHVFKILLAIRLLKWTLRTNLWTLRTRLGTTASNFLQGKTFDNIFKVNTQALIHSNFFDSKMNHHSGLKDLTLNEMATTKYKKPCVCAIIESINKSIISHVSLMYLSCVFENMYFSCISHVFLMYFSCISHVFLMHFSCIFHVYLMYLSYVSLMYLSCISHVCLMYNLKTCISDVSLMYLSCIYKKIILILF